MVLIDAAADWFWADVAQVGLRWAYNIFWTCLMLVVTSSGRAW